MGSSEEVKFKILFAFGSPSQQLRVKYQSRGDVGGKLSFVWHLQISECECLRSS